MRSILFIFLLSFLLLGGCSNEEYFFDKDTFTKDHITYMNYDAYQKPLRLEFEYWSREKTKNIFSMNEEEIRFVFEELKKSERIVSKPLEAQLVKGVPRYVWFFVRRLEDENGGEIVLHADINKNKVAEVYNGTYVTITEDLWNFLLEVERRKENIPSEPKKQDVPQQEIDEAESNDNGKS